MTCIVGLVSGKSVWLGGDRVATDSGLNRTLIKEPKVFKKGYIGFGVCGLPKVMDAIQHAIEMPPYSGEDPKAFLVTQVIPAIREGLKKLECAGSTMASATFTGRRWSPSKADCSRSGENFSSSRPASPSPLLAAVLSTFQARRDC